MKLLLRREPTQPDHRCTLGLLFVGDLSLVTIERPWVPTDKGKGGTAYDAHEVVVNTLQALDGLWR